jgi:hypothetical protein
LGCTQSRNCAFQAVLEIGADADPLSVQAGHSMGALLIIALLTIALAARAGVYRGRWRPAESEWKDESGFFDACVRTLMLVLMSLFGLFALGILYGNVLGSGAANLAPLP